MQIGLNINAQKVGNKAALLTYLSMSQPAAVLVMDGVQLARDIQNLLPDTIVIHRWWPDGALHVWEDPKYNPRQWVRDRVAELNDNRIYIHTTNEPGASIALNDWHEEAMDEAAKLNARMVVLNFSVGTPGPDEWHEVRGVIDRANARRDLFIIGLHEYFCGVPTSGFIGGMPRFIQPESWPNKEQALNMTMWHCGRFKFLVDYCRKEEIPVPRLGLTEHGADDLADMHEWTKTLPLTAPWQNIRGFRSLENYWRLEYPQWSRDRAFFEMLRYLDMVVYQDSPIEFQLIFTWSHAPDWAQFNVSTATNLLKLLVDYSKASSPVSPPDKPSPPLPGSDDKGVPVLVASAKPNVPIRFRQLPAPEAPRVGLILDEVEATMYSKTPRVPMDLGGVTYMMQKFKINGVIGWAAIDLLVVREPGEDLTVPVPNEKLNNLRDRVYSVRDRLNKMVAQVDSLIDYVDNLP